MDQRDEDHENFLEHPPIDWEKHYQARREEQFLKEELSLLKTRRDYSWYANKYIYSIWHTKLLESLTDEPHFYSKLNMILRDIAEKVIISSGRLNLYELKTIIARYFSKRKIEKCEQDNPECFVEIINALSDFIDMCSVRPIPLIQRNEF